MKGYRFITSDDTSELSHRVTEAKSNGRTLYSEPKMIFDNKRGGNALCSTSYKKLS